MILPNGHYVVVRDKYLRQPDGNLVLEIEVWRDAADFKANPMQPRAAHDWLHFAHVGDLRRNGGHYPGEFNVQVDPNFDLLSAFVATLQGVLDKEGNGKVGVRAHPRRTSDDPFGWLSHPHVIALEVTPR